MDQTKGKKPEKPKSFPNYLLTKSDETTENRAPKSSSFVADEILDTTPSVPFLRQNKAGLRQPVAKETGSGVEKSYFIKEQKRFNKEKQAYQEQQNWKLNGTFYQSRRPFKQTEFPSLWSTYDAKKKDQPIDYQTLKSELYVPTEDLILIDLNPPSEEPAAQVTESVKRPAPKKALHRSLLGIMEQEQLQNNWENRSKRPEKPDSNGYRSYFD